jgi:hypothetical protein
MAAPFNRELVSNGASTSFDEKIVSWEVPEDADPQRPMNW